MTRVNEAGFDAVAEAERAEKEDVAAFLVGVGPGGGGEENKDGDEGGDGKGDADGEGAER